MFQPKMNLIKRGKKVVTDDWVTMKQFVWLPNKLRTKSDSLRKKKINSHTCIAIFSHRDSHTHFVSVYSYDVQMELRRLSVLWDADQSPNHRAAIVGPSTHVTLGASAAWQCSGLVSASAAPGPRTGGGCADAASNVVTILAARVRVPILHQATRHNNGLIRHYSDPLSDVCRYNCSENGTSWIHPK